MCLFVMHLILHRASNYATTDLPLLDPSLVILVVDSQAPHNLAVGGEYNARRDSCYSAAKKMGKDSLRDASMADLEGRRILCNITKICRGF